jgi:hypothetical protein
MSHVEALRRLGRSPFWGPSILFGTIVTAAAALLYVVLTALFLPTAGLDPVGAVSLKLAFAQAYTGFAAIFLAGVLGYLAIQEFAEAQQHPQLKLVLQPSDSDTLSFLVDEQKADPVIFTISILNEGAAVGVWYQVELRVPFSLAPEPLADMLATSVVRPVMGTIEENWRFIPGHGDAPHLLAFISGGKYAAFRDFPLVLCQFTLRPSGAVVSVGLHTLHYVIASDRAAMHRGKLTIRIERSAPEHQPVH